MCDVKNAFERVAQLDSQNIKHLAQDWNLPWLEQEAAHNEKNPGRAITKAAEYALGGYLGGAYGGLYDSAGAAGGAAADAASTAQDVAAAQQAAQQAGLIDPYAVDVTANSTPGYSYGLLDKGKIAANNLAGNNAANGFLFGGGGGGGSSKAMLALEGLKMMQPQQAPQGAGGGRPFQASQGSLPSMYQSNPYQARPMSSGPYGTSAGNSLGINDAMLTEEQKRKLRAQGVIV